MATLIKKLEDITSTQDDDYFSTDYKLDLLNRAKTHLIEIGITAERQQRRSLRFLDSLRVTQSVSFDAFTSYQDFYKTTASKPSNLNEWISLDLDGINLAEIDSLFEVKHGNALPDSSEGYFLVYGDKFEFYLDNNTYNTFTLRYVKVGSDLISTDTEVSELGAGAERAILYYAATLMADTDVTIPAQLFKDEFNAYVRDLLS